MKQQSENLQEIKGDEAVASGVWPISSVNDAGTPARSGTPLTQRRSGPVRYRLISPDGQSIGIFNAAQEAASAAGDLDDDDLPPEADCESPFDFPGDRDPLREFS